MSLVIPSGQSWLRVELFSPANFGSSGGRATLDRPVALNPWTDLPVLAFSSLRGVLAGRFGDVYTDVARNHFNKRRTSLFGNPDHEPVGQGRSPGKAGDLVVGDGELAAFPAPIAGHGASWVIPLDTVGWLARLGFLSSVAVPEVADDVRAYTMLDRLPAGIEADGDPSIVPALLAALAPLLGKSPHTLIVAARGAARILWRHATEVRTLTALKKGSKQVRGGSLRRVELLPAGSILLVLLTNTSDRQLDLGVERFQLGAWESWGCGFVQASVLRTAPAAGALPVIPPEIVRDHAPSVDDEQLMMVAFDAVRNVPTTLRPKLRPLLRQTGTRLRTQGIASTLAFSLAKAKFNATQASPEREAHRWLLQTFFPGQHAAERTVETIRGDQPAEHVEGLCHWLSRYAELLQEQAESLTSAEGV